MSATPVLDPIPFPDSTPLVRRPAALRARAADDGFLFFRGLLPAADVLRMRKVMLAEAQKSGWTDSERSEDGFAKPNIEPVIEGGSEAWRNFYCRVYKQRQLHALNQHPALIGAFEALFGEAVLAHPRVIARLMFPNAERFTTPPHQDHFYIGGTTDTWTAWVPLGDCPVELGGLTVAAGSHRAGLLPVESADGAGGHRVQSAGDLRWASGAFQAGDVLAFHSHTVHQGRDNRTPDRLRLSCDFRFQPRSAPVHASSLAPHMGWLTWPEVYESWPAEDPLRHYWQQIPQVRPSAGVGLVL